MFCCCILCTLTSTWIYFASFLLSFQTIVYITYLITFVSCLFVSVEECFFLFFPCFLFFHVFFVFSLLPVFILSCHLNRLTFIPLLFFFCSFFSCFFFFILLLLFSPCRFSSLLSLPFCLASFFHRFLAFLPACARCNCLRFLLTVKAEGTGS